MGTKKLSAMLASVPIATSLSGLSILLRNSVGGFLVTTLRDLSDAIQFFLFNPSVQSIDVDKVFSSGVFALNGLTVTGTLPNISMANYGHLIVLERAGTAQQVLITRTGVCLRFGIIAGNWQSCEWQNWVILSAS